MPKRKADAEFLNTMADNLFILRIGEQKTLREVADKVGITFQTLNYYERGIKEPGLFIAASLAKYYGVTLDDLLNKELPFRRRPSRRI